MNLSAQALCINRGERPIIDDLSFSVRQGEALVVTGPNGAGKSTLLKALAGFIGPKSGVIRLEGGDPEKALPEQSHYLGHLNALKPQLTVHENLLFWQRYLGRGESIETALQRVDLPGIGGLPAAFLSAGQKRRVAISRLLVSRRAVWLLDEPTAALDAASAGKFASLVDEHLAGGGIVVAATHQPLGLGKARTLQLYPLAAPEIA